MHVAPLTLPRLCNTLPMVNDNKRVNEKGSSYTVWETWLTHPAGVVPIVLYCNSITKYCNTLVLQNLKVLQYLLQTFQVLQKVLQNMKVLQKVLQFFSSIVKSIAKYESIAKIIAKFKSIATFCVAEKNFSCGILY